MSRKNKKTYLVVLFVKELFHHFVLLLIDASNHYHLLVLLLVAISKDFESLGLDRQTLVNPSPYMKHDTHIEQFD